MSFALDSEMAGLKYALVPFVLTREIISQNIEAVKHGLDAIQDFSTTSIWLPLKGEDYFLFVSGYHGSTDEFDLQFNPTFPGWVPETEAEIELW